MSNIARLLGIATIFLLSSSCNTVKKEKLPVKNYMVSKRLDKAILGQSWQLLEKAQQMADTGSTINDVIALFPKDTQFMVNNNSLIYFLEGSVPMLVSFDKTSQITKGGGASNTKNVVTIQTKALITPITSLLVQQNSDLVHVVGAERGEKDRQAKNALIIAGDPDYFAKDDDALVAQKYLGKSHNYKKGQLDYVPNTQLSLQHFREFAAYDLVHLSSHGLRYCNKEVFANDDEIEISYGGESNYCRLLVETGIKVDFLKKEDANDFLAQNPEYTDHIVIGKETFYLKASFFAHFYGQKDLKDKIWVFSACEMGQRSDMRAVMQGILKNSHFFYWLNTVKAKDAYTVLDEFYKNLTTEGVDAKKAFKEVPYNLKKIYPDVTKERKDTTIDLGTELLHLQTGKPHHGIEVVELLHPIHETILQEGDLYPLNGDFGDGQTELMEVKLDLLGYTKAEFLEKKMTLSLFVRGNAILDHFAFLPDMPKDGVKVEKIPGKEYGVRLSFDGLEIGDIPKDLEKMEVKGYLHLDDERFSIHSETVSINPKDVKVTARGTNTVTITYDNDTDASVFKSISAPSDVFIDTNGFVYVYVERPQDRGWKKINLSGFMGQQMANKMTDILDLPMDVDILLGKEGLSTVVPNIPKASKNMFKPLINWPNQITQAKLSRSPNFERRETTCLSGNDDCLVFYGTQGKSKGMVIYFNERDKLEQMKYKGQTLIYEYGDYTVTPPPAIELKIPTF